MSWGEVLGATAYQLYARPKGAKEFKLLYRGLQRLYVDRRAGIRTCNAIPGETHEIPAPDVVEYAVTASNGNGESVRSRIADSDPASWRNWDPRARRTLPPAL